MDTLLESYFPRTNPKSRLFHIVKEVPTSGIPKIGWWRELWNSRNTDYFHIGADLWNSIYIVYYFSFPICWIPKIGTIFKIFDLCISRSTSYFWNGPISGIPIVGTIWSAFRFLEFQKYGNSLHLSFSLLSNSILIQNAMNNLTFYPLCKEFVGYLFHSLYFRRNFRGPRSTNVYNYLVFSREYGIHLK